MGKLQTLELQLKQSILWAWIVRIIFLVFIIVIFFFSIDLMIHSLASIGKSTVNNLVGAAEVPFVALFIGLLSTGLIQSSSTITSMTVSIVASGAISFSSGVYIIMGANIGTTLTSDIVALGYFANRSEFRKAVSAATVHDFFNIFTTIIIFPLEYYYHFLSNLAIYATESLGFQSGGTNVNLGELNVFFLNPLSETIVDLVGNKLIILLVSVILLFFSIKLFSSFSYKWLIGESKDKIKQYIFSNPLKSFTWGLLFTGAVQSSSITTSMVVPLVATRKVSLASVFPFIMGANIGTTITALLAGLLKSEVAISLAMAHVLFNFIGVLIFLPFSSLRAVPEFFARNLGYYASNNRIVGFFYILVTFFIIPFFLIYLSK
jgi:sodium-dependent phosphate cotransporter